MNLPHQKSKNRRIFVHKIPCSNKVFRYIIYSLGGEDLRAAGMLADVTHCLIPWPELREQFHVKRVSRHEHACQANGYDSSVQLLGVHGSSSSVTRQNKTVIKQK